MGGGGGGVGRGYIACSRPNQLTGHFQSFFLIFSETVKLVIGKPTVCIISLDILSFSKKSGQDNHF